MDEYALLLQSHSEERARELMRERYSMSGSQKPFLVLHEGAHDRLAKSAGATARTTKKKMATSRRRQRKSAFSKQLAEFIRSADQSYELYEPLHTLWSAYIAGLLGTPPNSAQPNSAQSNSAQALQTVLAADWHGAYVHVRAARNASLVGIEGLVLWESRSQWLVATRARGFKQVAKRGALLDLCAGALCFAIVGDRVLCRSSERTTRKFKPHDVAPIAPLLTHLL